MSDFEKLVEMVEGLAASVQRIEDALGGINPVNQGETRRGAPRKYDWDTLVRDGKLFVPCAKSDRNRLVSRLSASANQRFGAGKVRTRKVGAGVWAFKKGDW